MYKFHNANPLELFTDDCTIRAISMAEGNTWDYTYDKLSDLAQEKGTLFNNRDFILWYLDSHYKRVPTYDMNVGELSYYYKDKVLLITMPNHITISKYGTIYDIFDCRKYQVEYAWLIKG